MNDKASTEILTIFFFYCYLKSYNADVFFSFSVVHILSLLTVSFYTKRVVTKLQAGLKSCFLACTGILLFASGVQTSTQSSW